MKNLLFSLFLISLICIIIINFIDCEASYLDSVDLSRAYNAAQSAALDKQLLSKLNRLHPSVQALATFTCMPDQGLYKWPEAVLATGSLKTVLDVFIFYILQTNVLKIGGLKFNTSDGNYQVDPPVGFWPEYLAAVVDEFNEKYRKLTQNKITVERIYYQTSDAAIDGLYNGEVYLVEPYFVLGAFYNGYPRIESTRIGCSSMGYESTFHVRASTSVKNPTELYDYILGFTSDKRFLGTISESDYYAAESIIPPNTRNIIASSYERVL